MKIKFTAVLAFLFIASGLCQNAEWLNFNSGNSIMPGNQVNGIAVDSQGVKWVAAESGFVKIKDSTFSVYNAQNSPLTDQHPLAVIIDLTNNKWIGTTTQGLVKYNDTTFTMFDPSNSPLPGYKIG